jgi:acetolactate synthase I/II/III large subunit
MKIAQRFAWALSELGITRAYGLPGEDHMTLLHALDAAGIEYCTAFNESSAVIMAATDARLTGRPGVAVLSLAPGVSNGMNGILHAYLEGLPVLVISGQHAANKLPFVVRQGFDTEEMVRPTTKWTTRVPAGADPCQLVCKAADVALGGRPGPVFVELADEVAMAESPDTRGDQAVTLLRSELNAEAAGTRTIRVAAPQMVDELVKRLGEAERPVLILGGRRDTLTHEAARGFADTCRVPTFTTTGQKGALDSRSPYFAGTLLNGNLEGRLLSRADLILTVDFEAYDVYNRPWAYSCPTISVSAEPLAEWFQPFALRVITDPQTCLEELTKRLGTAGSSRFSPQDVQEYRDGLRSDLLDDPVDGSGLSVARAVDTALEYCDEGTIVCADAGFSKPIIALLSDTARRHHFLASNALSTMGFSIPAGIAASRASGGRVMAFMGDGSLLMRATELPIAAMTPVPPVFIAIVDRSLSQIEIKQSRRHLSTVGVRLPPISCEKLGSGLGIRGADAHEPEEICAALADAWSPTAPALLLGIHVDPGTSQRTFDLLRG